MCISETVFLVPDCDPKNTNTQKQDMTKCHFDSKAKSALFFSSCSRWSQGYMYYVCSIPRDRFECSKLFNGEDQTRPDQTTSSSSVLHHFFNSSSSPLYHFFIISLSALHQFFIGCPSVLHWLSISSSSVLHQFCNILCAEGAKTDVRRPTIDP